MRLITLNIRLDPDILRFAVLRYPDDHSLLAHEFFLSDRQHAGLGAIPKRRHALDVVNKKEQRPQSGDVYYQMLIHRASKVVFEPLRIVDDIKTSPAFIQTRTLPLAIVDLSARFNWHDFNKRDMVAKVLWSMRKQRSRLLATASR